MALEITDQRYGSFSKTLPDMILLILAKEYPLTVGQITKILKGEFKAKVSYQAVRKSLFALAKRKILAESENKFSVSKEYLKEQKRLLDQFFANYFTAENKEKLPLYSKKREEYTTYTFETLLQVDKFWGELVLDWAYNLKKEDDKRFVFNGPHCWYVLGHLGAEYDFLNLLKANGVTCYYLVEGKTLLDKWSKDFYQTNGAVYKINEKKNPHILRTAMGVFGDNIIQFDYPEDIFRQMEKFYSSTKSFSSLEINKIAEILKKKTSIKFIFSKNQVVADKLKEEIIAKCKN